MTKSETLRRRIVLHLRTAWAGVYGSTWVSFKDLAAELGEPEHNVKREVRRLARAGVVYYTQLFTEDMKLNGGGYILSQDWLEHKPGRAEDPEYPAP